MPDCWIHICNQKKYDAHSLDIGNGRSVQVEGQLWQIYYYPQATAKTKPSELQILLNFENAVKKLGGTVLLKDKSKETMRVIREGKEVWITVQTSFTASYTSFIVEKKAMEQDIVANADAFSNDLKATDHSAVYGIYFDTGKSELKLKSEQAMKEIVKLLKSETSLKVYVVGHTDNVGALNANMKLSQDRGEAAVQALIRSGIESPRLKAFGNGPYAPVASNDTEEGRGKNRQVELVKQ